MPAWWLVLLAGVSSLAVFLCYIFACRVGDARAVGAGSFGLLLFAPLIGDLGVGAIPSLRFWRAP